MDGPRSKSSLTPWTTLGSAVAFEHEWYVLRRDTVELPGGVVIDDYFVSVRPDVALVVAVTPEQEIVVVWQYKHGIGEITCELPGGLVEAGETPEVAAARELREETGYACERLEPLAVLLHGPSKDTNRVHGFLGVGARLVAEPALDRNEEIVVELLARDAAASAIQRGVLAASDSVALVLLALRDLDAETR